MKDYYKVLGVSRTASTAEIKRCYRTLLKQCHPDVNTSEEATNWTRQITEAYATLGDAESKSAYDIKLKAAEFPTAAKTNPPISSAADAARKSPTQPARTYCCEGCGTVDATLRMAVTWRVFSLIFGSRKVSTVRIHCDRCRVKASLLANVVTVIFGWWSPPGFFWTMEALVKNACGGDQPVDNNVHLLNLVGYQLFQSGRGREAYTAISASYQLRSDSRTKQLLDQLRSHAKPEECAPMWGHFRRLKMHPAVYHACAAVVLASAVFAISEITSVLRPEYVVQRSTPAPPSYTQKPRPQKTPVFSEPEEPIPDNGSLLFISVVMANNDGVTAPLKIGTRSSDGNYVVKIEGWDNREFVSYVFIRRGSTAELAVPLGSYRLKFASGDRWYGLDHLFGPSTSYSYVRERMDFTRSGNSLMGHRIELIPQVGGNLKTPRMPAAEW